MKKALITGITGFKGSHLAEYCLAQGMEVHGLRRPRSREDHIIDGVQYHDGDIRDPASMLTLLGHLKPDYLWHLAAQAFVPQSNIAPHDTVATNIGGTLNVLEAARIVSGDTCVVVAGSSEEYGVVDAKDVPITEECPLHPVSVYGVTKVVTDQLGAVYHALHGLSVVRVRSFNTTGPRRGEQYVCSRFAKAVAMIEVGKREPHFTHGNLDAVRDFSDVRDIVAGYYRLAIAGAPGEVYNLCSGAGQVIGDVLATLIGMASVPITTEKDPALVRRNEVPNLIGSAAKAKAVVGWNPQFTFQETLGDLLAYWRARV